MANHDHSSKMTHTDDRNTDKKPLWYLSPDSLTAATSLLTTNRTCSHPPYFDLTQHLSLSAPQDLSTALHLFYLSCLLPPHHTSFIFLPVAQHSIPPAPHRSNSLSSPFQHHYIFFLRASCPSYPIPLSQLPTSISLPLPKTLLSSLPLTHPPCYFAVPSAE